jgi:hypothetical protein
LALDGLGIRVEIFESEMSNASLETTTYLGAHGQLRGQSEFVPAAAMTHASTKMHPFDKRPWEAPYDHQRGLLLALWLCMFVFVQAVLSWFF